MKDISHKFKIRSSAIGTIMTPPKLKADKEAGNLSQSAKSWCDKWIIDQIYNRQTEISSKYTAKGHLVEDESIDLMSRALNIPFLSKNDVQYNNEFITGEPDVLPDFEPNLDLIIDAKNSFSYETFPILEQELPNKDYWWQGQGYMAMTGRSRYKVCYMLSNTPEHMISSQAWTYCRLYGMTEIDQEVYQRYWDRMTYDDVPDELRVKVFDFNRDDEAIQSVYEKVKKCREYIKEQIMNLPRYKNGHLIIVKPLI